MTFAEFWMACSGFEDFHAAPSEDKGHGAPSVEAHLRAMGITQH